MELGKLIYKFFVANARAVAQQRLHEKRCQLMMADKMHSEYHDMLAAMKYTQVRGKRKGTDIL